MRYNGAVAVTPHASNDQWGGGLADALYIGGAGNLQVVTANGQTVVINGVTAGTLLELRVSRVLAASTTATNITALFGGH